MSARLWLELALIVIAAAAGWGYVHQRDERLRAEGRLEIMEQRADSTAEVARAAVQASEERDSAAARVIRREAAGRAAAEQRAVRAEQRLPAASDAVITAAGPDSAAVRAALSELEALYEERDQARLARIASDSVVIAELNELDRTRVVAIKSLEAALAASQAEVAELRAARPGWLERALPKIAIGAAFVGGWLLRGAVGG